MHTIPNPGIKSVQKRHTIHMIWANWDHMIKLNDFACKNKKKYLRICVMFLSQVI